MIVSSRKLNSLADARISVIIITRNRYRSLSHCLASLISQSNILDELVIIDNASQDETKDIVLDYKKVTSVSIRYIFERKIGYPFARNRGLKAAKNKWVAFIDDDCVASLHWYEEMKKSILKHNLIAAIAGQCETYDKQNVFSLVHHSLNEYWKAKAREGEQIVDLETLDTKNIVFNKLFLQKNGLKFDEKRFVYGGGVSEDCDFGMRIQKSGGKAFYNSKMAVIHQDPTNFLDYFSKLMTSTKYHLSYEKEWMEFRKKLPVGAISRLSFFSNYLSDKNINLLSKILFYFYLVSSVFYIKMYHKIKL